MIYAVKNHSAAAGRAQAELSVGISADSEMTGSPVPGGRVILFP